MNILVVGGAGYIGSHCVRQLLAAGHTVSIIDNLVYGHTQAVPEGTPFYQQDLGDIEGVKTILRQDKIEVVMHFAAYAYVGESVNEPFKYYFNNFVATLNLLKAMIDEGVNQFVFSSSCATFGTPEEFPITEDTPQAPINPYGQTKLDVENALRYLSNAHGLSFASLRYFNASGAAEDGSLGEDHDPETHLIPLVLDVALGKRPCVQIYGTDYDTPDGTCLRDYIHVDDIARAHIMVFDKLKEPGTQLFYNLGTQKPTSVREVIAAAEAVTGKTITVEEAPRRPGDPAALYADASKAKRELGWEPQFKDIQSIIETAWKWASRHPEGYQDQAKA